MAFYRRFRDGRTQRHDYETGEFADCPPDEPETRARKPNEGLVVLPAESIIERPGAPIIEIPTLLDLLQRHNP